MTEYLPDTFYTSITLTPGTDNVLVVKENSGGSTFTVTLIQNSDTASTTPETWWLHDDDSWHATKPGLLYAIKKLLNDGTTVGAGTLAGGTPANTYTWAVVDPTSSTGLTNNGLQLRADAATYDFDVAWTHASTTLDGHLLGTVLTVPASDDASTTSGSDEVFSWPEATKHRMVSRDLLDGHAVDKRRHYYKDVRTSSPRPSDAVHVVWDEGYFRTLRYEDVPAAEVFTTRSNEAAYAGITTRATGDEKATWWQVWDTLSVGEEVIIVHNSSSDLQIDANTYEVVKLWRPMTWGSFASQQSPGGDFYAIEFSVWVNESSSSYDH